MSSCSSASDSPARMVAIPSSNAPPLARATPSRPIARAPAGRPARPARPPRRASRRGRRSPRRAGRRTGGSRPIDQPLGRRLARQAVGRVGLGGDAAGGQRALAVALERVDAGDPPLGVGQRAPRPLGPPRRDDLALGPRASLELAGQLGVARVLLQHGDALAGRARPRARGRAPGARGGRVAVGVHGRALGDRVERARRARGWGRARRASGRRSRRGRRRVARERLGQPAVEPAAPQPRHVLVDRLARQRVPERRPARLGLDDQPVGRAARASPSSASVVGDEAEVERGPATAATSAAARAAVGQRRRSHEHGVAHRAGAAGTSPSSVELEAVRRGAQAVGRPQRGGQLLDEERRRRRCGRTACAASRADGGVPRSPLHEQRRSPARSAARARSPRARGRGAGRGAAGAAGARAAARRSGRRRRRAAAARAAAARARPGARGSPRLTTGGRRAGSPTGPSAAIATRPQRIASKSVARSSLGSAGAELGQQHRRAGPCSGPHSSAPSGSSRRYSRQRRSSAARTASRDGIAAPRTKRHRRAARGPPRPAASCPTPASPVSSTSEPATGARRRRARLSAALAPAPADEALRHGGHVAES